MRYGVVLPTYRGLASAANIAATARRAEELGIREKLVVVMQSEMGRTPNYNKGEGKDHWSIGSAITDLRLSPRGSRHRQSYSPIRAVVQRIVQNIKRASH